MSVIGYVLEVIGIWMFFSAFRHARRRDFLDEHGTEEGKKYAAKMRAVAVGSRVVIGLFLLTFGMWTVRASH